MNCPEVMEALNHDNFSSPSSDEDQSEFFRPSRSKTFISWYEISPSRGKSNHAQSILRGTKYLDALFEREVFQWRRETRFLSSVHDITSHPSYRRIMSFGRRAIPLILRDLELNGGEWYFALRKLTGQHPVCNADRGYVKRMNEAWLEWGRKNHYL